MQDTQESDIEAVTLTDILGLTTWDRPRSSDELQGFITRHENAISHMSLEQ